MGYMMTDRQAKILAAIIEQYAELAAPVGSVLLAKLFGVSSATIRSEMSRLEDMGYITQPHTIAGRIPTDRGYRLYVNSIVEGDEVIQSTTVQQCAVFVQAAVTVTASHAIRQDGLAGRQRVLSPVQGAFFLLKGKLATPRTVL